MPQPQNVREVQYALNRVRDRIQREFTAHDVRDDPARFLEMRDLEWALRETLRAAQEWEARWRQAHKGQLLRNWDLQNEESRRWMDRTELSHHRPCSTCGDMLRTEGDFARHYVIPDVNYPNIGHCWTREGQRRMPDA